MSGKKRKTIKSNKLDSNTCKTYMFSNGLKCLVYNDACFKGANVSLYVHCGSRNESKKNIYGISHLIEHMMFKGTKKRKDPDIISKDIYKLGGFTNAFTGVELTGYYIGVPCDKLEKAVEILSDMLYNSKLTEEDIETEKKVVINELKQRSANPIYVLSNMVNESVFSGSTLGKSVGGTDQSVSGITWKNVMMYLKQYYRCDRMTLIMVSNGETNDMVKIAKKYFGKPMKWKNWSDKVGQVGQVGQVGLRGNENGEGSELGKDFMLKQDDKRVLVKNVAGLEHAFICFAFPNKCMNDKSFLSGEVLGNIMAGNMMSRLFIELREKRGLVYNVKFGMDMYRDGGTFTITLSTGNNKKQIDEVIKVVMTEMKRIKRKGIEKDELKVFKDYMIGNWTMDLNNPSEMAEFYGIPAVLMGKIMSKKQYLNGIRKIGCNDIKRVARELFREKALNLCVIAH